VVADRTRGDLEISEFWTKQPEQVYLNTDLKTSQEYPIPSVDVSEGIFICFDSFQRDQFLGKPKTDSVIVYATTRRVDFIASLDTRTSRLLFILWKWSNKMIGVRIWIDWENSDVYNTFLRTAFWSSASGFFCFKIRYLCFVDKTIIYDFRSSLTIFRLLELDDGVLLIPPISMALSWWQSFSV
jgi:hypothetical protein